MQEDYLEEPVEAAKLARRISDAFATPGKTKELFCQAGSPARTIDQEHPGNIFAGQYAAPLGESPLEESPKKQRVAQGAVLGPIRAKYLKELFE